MCKDAKGFKVILPQTDSRNVVHAMHRVAEGIRLALPQVGLPVCNTKKAFLKAPSRVAAFRDAVPDAPLPPQPILTRWGTLIYAVAYYCRHFNLLKSVLEQLTDDAVSVTVAKKMFGRADVERDLACFNANFCKLSHIMTKMETITLNESLKIVEDVRESLQQMAGKGATATEKMEELIKKNRGLSTLRKIRNIPNAGDGLLEEELSPHEVSYFKVRTSNVV
ncbi:unnamed protein product [Ixodes hexagonus]